MNAMTASERNRRYREKRKREGRSAGESIRLGIKTHPIVRDLAKITGDSMGEVVRVLIMDSLRAKCDENMSIEELASTLSILANRESEAGKDREALDLAVDIVKETHNAKKGIYRDTEG